MTRTLSWGLSWLWVELDERSLSIHMPLFDLDFHPNASTRRNWKVYLAKWTVEVRVSRGWCFYFILGVSQPEITWWRAARAVKRATPEEALAMLKTLRAVKEDGKL